MEYYYQDQQYVIRLDRVPKGITKNDEVMPEDMGEIYIRVKESNILITLSILMQQKDLREYGESLIKLADQLKENTI